MINLEVLSLFKDCRFNKRSKFWLCLRVCILKYLDIANVSVRVCVCMCVRGFCLVCSVVSFEAKAFFVMCVFAAYEVNNFKITDENTM